MSNDDIARIIEQERALVFNRFDETEAFEIGSALRARGAAAKMPIVVEICLWDRLLFYSALQGSTFSNTEWARRKINVVKMFHCSTYRKALEQKPVDKLFNPQFGLDPADYVLAGGGFPLTVKDVGVIGAFAVSGLPQRDDHGLIVEVLAERLGVDAAALALPRE